MYMKNMNKLLQENMRRFRTIGVDAITEQHKSFPHEIKSEKYWRQIIASVNSEKTREFATKLLNTIMHKQSGRASDRQMEVLDRIRRGDTSAYHTKN